MVVERLAAALDDPLALVARISPALQADELRRTMALAAELAAKVRSKDRAAITPLIESVQILPGTIRITLAPSALGSALALAAPEHHAGEIALTAEVRLTRTGLAMKLVQPSGKAANDREPDQPMLRLLAQARQRWGRLSRGDIDIATLAREQGVNDSLMSRVVRLAFLSPDMVETILAGEQPARLDASRLVTMQLPCDWREQAEALAGL